MGERDYIPQPGMVRPAQKASFYHQICFNRHELNQILSVYSRHVIAGDWCDYALEVGPNEAAFTIFGQRARVPAYRIVKCRQKLRRYRLIEPGGRIVSMGNELRSVLSTITRPKLRLM